MGIFEKYKKNVSDVPLSNLEFSNDKNPIAEIKKKENNCSNPKIQLDPNDALSYYNLGNTYYQQKRYIEAEQEYKKAIQLDPNKANYYSWLGEVYYQQGKYAEAELEFKNAIQLDPNKADYYSWLGAAYYHQGKYAESEREYKKAKQLD